MSIVVINQARCSQKEISKLVELCAKNNEDYIIKPLPPVYGRTWAQFKEGISIEDATAAVDKLLENYGTGDVHTLTVLTNLYDEMNHRIAKDEDINDIISEVQDIFSKIKVDRNE